MLTGVDGRNAVEDVALRYPGLTRIGHEHGLKLRNRQRAPPLGTAFYMT